MFPIRFRSYGAGLFACVVGYKDLAPTEPLFKNLLGLPLGYLKIAAWLLCYTIEGKAELYIEGQRVLLEPGDSWVIPIGAKHRYKILVPFTAIEVTSPPAEVHARDT